MNHNRLSDIAGLTHVGRRRRNNQDAIAWDAELGLALVADGVGGGQAGEVASGTAARSIAGDIRLAIKDPRAAGGGVSRESQARLGHELIRRANQKITSMAEREPGLKGMGTTLSMVLLGSDFATTVHIGDSRIYLLRDDQLAQLTRDHSVTEELAAMGHMSEEEAARSALRSTLSRALGVSNAIAPDIEHHALAAGDLYMLCTDGLTKAIPDAELAELLQSEGANLQDAANAAIDLANRRGGLDNISIVMMRIA
jgi:protein phosphatase